MVCACATAQNADSKNINRSRMVSLPFSMATANYLNLTANGRTVKPRAAATRTRSAALLLHNVAAEHSLTNQTLAWRVNGVLKLRQSS
jgi:hypothetical protein